jgi:chromosome segregation ATPase
MVQSKKKTSAAETLVDSLMEDIKEDMTEVKNQNTAMMDKTLAVTSPRRGKNTEPPPVQEKVGFGPLRSQQKASSNPLALKADAQLMQSDNLKLAQQRILELEKEIDKYRQDNELLSSAGEIMRNRADEYQAKASQLEYAKKDMEEQMGQEISLLRESLRHKDDDLLRMKKKIEELEFRLANDFKKIRVRERELENRLELAKMEKTALVRSKDESLLDYKRKIDQLQMELDGYKQKSVELHRIIDSNQEQFKRTVRALRLALTNLEGHEDNIVPIKKAE